jgi:putative ATPase
MAMDAARQDAEQGVFSPVPAHLRDSHYAGNERLGVKTGEAYKYPHDYPGHWVAQQYMPDDKVGVRYYFPSDQGHESKLRPRDEQRKGQE